MLALSMGQTLIQIGSRLFNNQKGGLKMIKIKYNNQEIFEEVSFIRSTNLVTITPTAPNTSGFTTWKLDGKTQLGDFSDFTTVYKVDGDSVSYSNDGSTYVEPPKPTEEELRRQALLSEKADLETWLKEHDYIGTKIATGRATVEEYATEIAEMSEKASRINEIDRELSSIN